MDRWDRRRTLILADLSRAALLLLLLTVHARADLPRVYAVALLLSAIAQFFGPAKGALLPRLVDEGRLAEANALNALGDNLPRLAGPALGGLLFGLVGFPAVVLLDSASFLLSAALITGIRVPPRAGAAPPPATSAEVPTGVTTPAGAGGVAALRAWRDGLRLVGQDRTLRTLLTVDGLAFGGQGVLDVLLVPFVERSLHGDAQLFGWLLTVQAIGGVVGGLAIGWASGRLTTVRLFGISLVLVGAIIAVVANVPLLPVILPLVALAGVPAVGWIVGGQTLLQASAPDRYRGRVLGAYATTSALARLGGMGVASLLGDRAGVVPLLSGAGGLHLVAGIAALALLRVAPPSRAATDTDEARVRAG